MKTHASLNLSYSATMAIYMLSGSVSAYLLIRIIHLIPFFSNKNEWTFGKEILAIFMVLAGTGITTYFMAFIMEEPSDRWNIPTFLDSCKYTLFVGIFPLGIFTLLNYRHLFTEEVSLEYGIHKAESESKAAEAKIHIISRLKKEELSFFPNQFLYAESDGNYVFFHLADDQKIRTELIRNSISDIERQLSGIPYFIRIHRAFIVNVKKVCSKKGNTLGYRLKIFDTEAEIPVSRNNVQAFDQRLKQFR